MKYIISLLLLLLNSAFAIACLDIPEVDAQFESGYIAVTQHDNLFYLLARAKKPDAPLVIYLAGGPGASSIAPAFLGYGPWNLKQPFQHNTDFQLVANKWSWHTLANIVFLDQPRYTGYSYGTGSYLTSIQAAGHEFLTWLENFYHRYPEFRTSHLYLAGESFAGEYIPEYSHQILAYNNVHPDKFIPIKGLFIVSGLLGDGRFGLNVSPNYQLHYLYHQKLLPDSTRAEQGKENIRSILDQCLNTLAKLHRINPDKIKISDVHIAGKNIPNCKAYLQ